MTTSWTTEDDEYHDYFHKSSSKKRQQRKWSHNEPNDRESKRFRKATKDNISGMTRPSRMFLSRKGGVKRINGQIFDESISVLNTYLVEQTERNDELQRELSEQNIVIETLNANFTDYEMKIDLAEAQNKQYEQTINEANEKYEDVMSELLVTRQNLDSATHQIKQYEQTIQSLNQNIIDKQAKHDEEICYLNTDHTDYKQKCEKLQTKYEQLTIECAQYKEDRQKVIKLEKENGSLNEHIAELTCSTIQLGEQLNDCFAKIEELNQVINALKDMNKLSNSLKSDFEDGARSKYFGATPLTTPKSPSKAKRKRYTPSPRSYVKKQFYSPPKKYKEEDKMSLLDNCSLEDGEHNLFSMMIYDDVEDNDDYLQKGNRERKDSKASLQSLVVEDEQKEQEEVISAAKEKENEHKALLEKIEKEKMKNIKILAEIERLRALTIQPTSRGFCIVQ